MAAVAAIYDQLNYFNTEVFGVSTDSVYSHKVFTEVSPAVSNIQFPLLSDRTHQISKAYRVLNEKTGAAFRATIIVDPEGIIASKLVYPLEIGRNVYELLRILQALQHSKETGEGTPANWMPNQPGIERNSRYIGRI